MLIGDNVLFSQLSDRVIIDVKMFFPSGLKVIFRDDDNFQIFAVCCHNIFLDIIFDRSLASVPNTIEVVKISFPQGLVLISRIQLRY